MRYMRIAMVSIAALALAGCSSSATTSKASAITTAKASPVSTTSTTAPPNVQSILLAISDLPTGWSVDNTPQSGVSTSCYSNPLTKAHSVAYAHVDFAQGGNLPELTQELGRYSSGPTAFTTISAILNKCKTFTESSNGQVVSGTMGEMSSPSYGNQSVAYDATLTPKGVGISLNQGFVMIRKGNYITLVALGDIGSVATATLQGFVNQAVAKIPS